MNDDAFSDWVQDNLESLQEAYVDYLLNSKVNDIAEWVFFWDKPEKDILTHARQAKDAWERWLEGQYENYCGQEMEPENMAGSER